MRRSGYDMRRHGRLGGVGEERRRERGSVSVGLGGLAVHLSGYFSFSLTTWGRACTRRPPPHPPPVAATAFIYISVDSSGPFLP